MPRLLLPGSRNRYLTAAAAAASRFHPNSCGGGIRLGVSPTSGKSSAPLLMVTPEVVAYFGGYTTDSHYNFLKIIGNDEKNKELIKIKKMNKLPWEKLLLPDDAVCIGSSHGWLALVHPLTCQIGLFNPFVSNSNNPFPYIPLPRTESLPIGHGVRIRKVDNLSQSPSLFRRFRFSNLNGDKFSLDHKEFIISGNILKKLALSSPPVLREEEYCSVVAVTCVRGLQFCKLGDSGWTALEGNFDREYSDVIYFSKHRRYYAVSNMDHYNQYKMDHYEQHDIESWDFTDPCCPKNTLIQPSMNTNSTKQFPSNPQGWRVRSHKHLNKKTCGKAKRYLVEDSGNLLLVVKFVANGVDKDGFLMTSEPSFQYTYYDEKKDHSWHPFADDESSYITVGFAVYKLDWMENKWEPVESLGDKALFVGINQSFAVSSHEFPDVMQNSIYFTDDNFSDMSFNVHSGGHD